MENLYTRRSKNECKLVKANPETVKFLLDYSKALIITESHGLQFEGNLN